MHDFDYLTLPAALTDPGITKLLLEIREHKGRQNLWLTARPDVLESLIHVAQIESTGSSNRIEGIVTTERRLADLMVRSIEPRGRAEEEIAGYRDVLALIHEQHDYIAISPNVILQLHRDLMRHTSLSYGGRWKDGDNEIVGLDDQGNRMVRFRPVPAVATPTAMERLCSTFRDALEADRYDPLLLVIRFVFDFLCIHPFNDGNGRMSRLLTVLLMEQSGYLVGRYISVERLIEDNKSLYYDALAASSAGWDENLNDEAPFVRFMLGVVLAAYRDLAQRVETVAGGGRKTKAQRVEDVFERRPGKITKAMIHRECPDISLTTIERALKQLVDEGRIVKVGGGRGTGYVLASPGDRTRRPR
ncbi:cell division protein Fic [Bifidobacterium lemurum]|uniref:Cell division protein Fic n=1 Tax=Bifidobacterium lemurum TaxID=1603886 RepID=A0A261FJ46_9BIFI|nr:Fic family protein [Bifidobacterium lemurum]OZG59190.1 cell division protein Fic [Bifidobacterium lemurum]QOL34979.1 Fic family protein [Bifidobacterium lemurum]